MICKHPDEACVFCHLHDDPPPMTDADRIRSMTDEELKDWYCKNRDCGGCDFCRPFGCTFKGWHKQSAEEDDKWKMFLFGFAVAYFIDSLCVFLEEEYDLSFLTCHFIKPWEALMIILMFVPVCVIRLFR